MGLRMVRALGAGVLIVAGGCASRVAGPPVAVAGGPPPADAPPPQPSVAKAPGSPAVVAAPPLARQLAQDETITMVSGSTLTVASWYRAGLGVGIQRSGP